MFQIFDWCFGSLSWFGMEANGRALEPYLQLEYRIRYRGGSFAQGGNG
jgi:hypothetical protein